MVDGAFTHLLAPTCAQLLGDLSAAVGVGAPQPRVGHPVDRAHLRKARYRSLRMPSLGSTNCWLLGASMQCKSYR